MHPTRGRLGWPIAVMRSNVVRDLIRALAMRSASSYAMTGRWPAAPIVEQLLGPASDCRTSGFIPPSRRAQPTVYVNVAVNRWYVSVALAVNSSTQIPFFTKRMVVTVAPFDTVHTFEGEVPDSGVC